MLDDAYLELHALEEKHWWYVGARAVYRTLLHIGFKSTNSTLRMLEIGSGSGANLSLLGEYGPTVGVELSRLALILTPVHPELGLVQARAEALPFAEGSFDGVHLWGVIEHLENDTLGLIEAARVCRTGGFVTILTSALPILWSHHDEANRHKRRYQKKQFVEALQSSGLVPRKVSYQNFFTLLPTLLIRLWQARTIKQPRYDMGQPPAFINSLLSWVLRCEARAIRYINLPIGVDLVAVCDPIKKE